MKNDIHQHYRHRAVPCPRLICTRAHHLHHQPAHLQLVQPVVAPVQRGHQNRTYLAGGQLLCRLRGYGDANCIRSCSAVPPRPRVPDGSGQLHGYKSLYKWGFTHFGSQDRCEKGDTLARSKCGSVHADRSTGADREADLVARCRCRDRFALEATPNLPEAVDAPIKAGDVVGSMTYSYNAASYGTVELVALSDVK